MRRIISSLDIGTNSIKLVVGEFQKDKLNILSCVNVPSQGIKNGYIVNRESAEFALQEAFFKSEEILGMQIKETLVNVPSYGLSCFISNGSVNINNADKSINHKHLIKAMQNSVYGKIDNNKELVSIMPAKFFLNDDKQVSSPINMVANKLTVSDVAVVIPKKNVENIVNCIEKLNIKVTDVCINPLCDFYEFKTDDMKKVVGVIVNIGHTKTEVSIFNKGILTASEIIDIGAINIDNDLAYIFKISKDTAKDIKEKLVVGDIKRASPSEFIIVTDSNEEDIKITGYDASAIAISRINEILNLVKKQISLLTKKEISYIIVTGGISKLKGFNTLLTNCLGNLAKVGMVEEIGARYNKYSVAVGMLKYYNSRLNLRNVNFSIFSEDEEDEFGGKNKRINVSDSSLLGKVFGYFFDN
ncbi:MAG: cell division protein FtsA [Mollicutes bacterium]|nr:cell division protein FtsA [Mollicutes bacterium]